MNASKPIARQVLELRARMVAKREPHRAASLLVASGWSVKDAVCFVLDSRANWRTGRLRMWQSPDTLATQSCDDHPLLRIHN